MSLLETAKNWTLFREALGPSCDLTEKEFKRLALPARLKRLVAVVGMEPLVAEIDATLMRLKVGYDGDGYGLSCGVQAYGGLALGWCPYVYEDPTFIPMNPYRSLPALVRLEGRLKGRPDYWDVHRKVRRLSTRTRGEGRSSRQRPPEGPPRLPPKIASYAGLTGDAGRR